MLCGPDGPGFNSIQKASSKSNSSRLFLHYSLRERHELHRKGSGRKAWDSISLKLSKQVHSFSYESPPFPLFFRLTFFEIVVTVWERWWTKQKKKLVPHERQKRESSFSVQGGGTENSVPYTSVSHILHLNYSHTKKIRNVITAQQTCIKKSANKIRKIPGKQEQNTNLPIPCWFIPITVICSGWVKLRKKRPDSRAEWRDAKWDPIVQSSYVQVRLVTVEGLVCGFFLFRSLGSTNHKSETAAQLKTW